MPLITPDLCLTKYVCLHSNAQHPVACRYLSVLLLLLLLQGATLRQLGVALSLIAGSIYACTSLWSDKNELCVSVTLGRGRLGVPHHCQGMQHCCVFGGGDPHAAVVVLRPKHKWYNMRGRGGGGGGGGVSMAGGSKCDEDCNISTSIDSSISHQRFAPIDAPLNVCKLQQLGISPTHAWTGHGRGSTCGRCVLGQHACACSPLASI